MSRRNKWTIAGLVLGLVSLGCNQPSGDYKTARQIKDQKPAAGHHDDHDHSAGPHGGSIVELGDDEYHAEVVVDGKSHTLRVFLFGADAKTPAPISAADVTVVTEDQQKLTLKPVPQAADGEGKSSLFESTDESAVDSIVKAGYLHGSLQLEAGGKPYRGNIDAHFDGTTHEEHADHKDADHKEEAKKEGSSDPVPETPDESDKESAPEK